jgi:glycerol uptake facilitator-like aquaporin
MNGGAFLRKPGAHSSSSSSLPAPQSSVPGAAEAISLAMKVVAPGLMVMAIIYFMGAVSGAHLNPAVTLAFAARRNFPWSRVPGYIAAQIIGGVAAASFLWAMFGAKDYSAPRHLGRA